MDYVELAFWEKAFLARAAGLPGIRSGANAEDCAAFADAAVWHLRRAGKTPLETPPEVVSDGR